MTPPASVRTTQRLGHIRPLDGLRAIAVLMVLGAHSGLAGFRGGRLGVDVFFVLSGFLITSLLIDEHRRTGTICLKAFYMRRALRLYPALLLAVSGALGLALLHGGLAGLKATLRFTPFALFYMMNILRAARWDGGVLGHTWSLSIEEQFYLVWPVVVVLFLRRRMGLARLGWVALACALGSAVLRTGLYAADFSYTMLYNATFSHVDGIFAGCAFAVLWSQRRDVATRLAQPSLVIAAIGLGVAVTVSNDRLKTFGYPLAVMATIVILAAVLTRPSSRLSSALSHPAAVAIGRRSYGLYLYHYPIVRFVGTQNPVRLGLSVLLSFAAAWVSYAVVERRFLALKRHWQPKPPTVDELGLGARFQVQAAMTSLDGAPAHGSLSPTPRARVKACERS